MPYKDPEKRRECNHKSYAANKEKRLERNREHYAANKEKYLERNRKLRAANRKRYNEYSAVSKLRQFYGIGIEERQLFFRAQHGKCAICLRETKLCVDHCHRTKIIRGLLCLNCNHLLGKANDDPLILQRAIQYLLDTQPRKFNG